MHYDEVKDRLEKIIGDSPLLRRMFFAALDRLFLRSRYIAREIRRLKRQGFDPQRIIDAGSGFGQYSFRLGRAFPEAEIDGIDVKPEIVDAGNRLAKRTKAKNVRFEVRDLLELDFKDSFDAAISVDVLEHIEEDRQVIGNIGRALKAGGLFIFTTPFYDGVNPGGAEFIDEHVRPGYTREEAQEKLEEAGFDIRQLTITYGFWGNIAWKLLQRWPMGALKGRIWLLPLVLMYFLFSYPLAWFCMLMDMRVVNQKGGGMLVIAVRRGTE